MDKSRFQKSWLIASVITLVLAVTGCLAPSSTFTEQAIAADSSAGGSASTAAERVRISRAFFERSVVGKIRIAGGETQIEKDSNVQWVEYEPTTPLPPDQDIQFDMRDFEGCAVYEDAVGVRLCFNVMPDVSSLGVNADEVRVRDANALVNGSGCEYDFKFNRASREDGVLTVTFVSQPAPGSAPECSRAKPYSIDLVLRQI